MKRRDKNSTVDVISILSFNEKKVWFHKGDFGDLTIRIYFLVQQSLLHPDGNYLIWIYKYELKKVCLCKALHPPPPKKRNTA